MVTDGDLQALWVLAQRFIRAQQIRSKESVYQQDNVIVNAYDFIADVCQLVGYHQDPDDDDEQ